LLSASRGQVTGKDRNLYAETRAWFLDDDERHPSGFRALVVISVWWRCRDAARCPRP
jgi:hypothetical protein